MEIKKHLFAQSFSSIPLQVLCTAIHLWKILLLSPKTYANSSCKAFWNINFIEMVPFIIFSTLHLVMLMLDWLTWLYVYVISLGMILFTSMLFVYDNVCIFREPCLGMKSRERINSWNCQQVVIHNNYYRLFNFFLQLLKIIIIIIITIIIIIILLLLLLLSLLLKCLSPLYGLWYYTWEAQDPEGDS